MYVFASWKRLSSVVMECLFPFHFAHVCGGDRSVCSLHLIFSVSDLTKYSLFHFLSFLAEKKRGGGHLSMVPTVVLVPII